MAKTKSVNDTICDVFDVDSSEKKVEDISKETSTAIAEIKDGIKEQKYNLEDKEYIAFELKNLIEANRMVLEGLAEQCRMGAQARMYEVYASLSNAIAQNLAELINLNKVVTDYQVREDDMAQKKEAMEAKKAVMVRDENGQPQLTQNNTTNYVFTSKEMLSMLKELDIAKPAKADEIPSFNLD